jgi:hypothetical protein
VGLKVALGLFRGVRTFTLAPGSPGATAFKVREQYTEPLLGMIWRSIPDLQPSFTGSPRARAPGG